MGDDSAATEVLTDSDSWNCLRGVSVGRLAVVLGDGPDIFPVNYTTDHGTIKAWWNPDAGGKRTAVE